MPEKIDAEKIAAELQRRGCPLLTMCFASVDSTNSEAKRQIKNGNRVPMLLAADTQTAGRGRMGRSFFSPEGSGLYMSLKLPGEMIKNGCITLCAAAATALTVEEFTGKAVSIKWVNDIYLDGRKLAGILAEAVTEQQTDYVIGIGLNVSTEVFPPELESLAASLHEDIPREALAAAVTARLLRYLASETTEEVLREYRARSMLLGKEIDFRKKEEVYHATAIAIEEDGALLVRYADGSEEALRSGEVTMHFTKEK